jgi:hypothetical protein
LCSCLTWICFSFSCCVQSSFFRQIGSFFGIKTTTLVAKVAMDSNPFC